MERSYVRQVVFPALTALIWGTALVAQDMCSDHVDIFTFNAIRSFVAVLVLLPIIWLFDKLAHTPVRSPAEKKRYFRRTVWGGFWCGTALAVASNFQQAGLVAGTDAGKAGFITALYVVLVPLCGLFFKRKASLSVWIAVALSVVALYLLCIGEAGLTLTPGDLLMLICAGFFTMHIYVIDHFTATVDGLRLSCVQFFFNGLWGLVLKVIFALLGANGIGDTTLTTGVFSPFSMDALMACAGPLLYLGVFSCGGAYTLQILAQKGSNPTVVTILLSLESVFAAIFSAIILHESMTPRELLGCALMFGAVILAQVQFSFKTKEPKGNA